MTAPKVQQISIGVAGERGSFSEEAAEEYASKHDIHNPKIKYLVGTENVLNAVQKGNVDKGIFPIENSNGGIVYESVHAMAKHVFTIEEIFEIDVQHCLLAKPGIKRDDIEVIASHDQALKQCRTYLRRNWPAVEPREYSDTALAARDLDAGKLSDTTAVIAPGRCATLYHLDILESNIQDLKFNFTAFIAAVK